jgi:cell division septation protein DedD
MATILGARVAGAVLACLSGLFLLSLLFTQGASTGDHQEVVTPTPAAPAPEADTETKLQEQGSAGVGMWDPAAGRSNAGLRPGSERLWQQSRPQAMEPCPADERQPYRTAAGNLVLVSILP